MFGTAASFAALTTCSQICMDGIFEESPSIFPTLHLSRLMRGCNDPLQGHLNDPLQGNKYGIRKSRQQRTK